MKKRRWYLFGIMLVLFSVLRFGLTYFFMEQSKSKLDIHILENYENISMIIGPLVFVVCIIGIIVEFSKIKKDLGVSEEAKTLKYHFPSFIAMIVAKSIFDIATVFVWETETLYLSQEIEKMKGLEVTLGHPGGIITLFAIFISIIEVVFAIVFSLILRSKYNKASGQ